MSVRFWMAATLHLWVIDSAIVLTLPRENELHRCRISVGGYRMSDARVASGHLLNKCDIFQDIFRFSSKYLPFVAVDLGSLSIHSRKIASKSIFQCPSESPHPSKEDRQPPRTIISPINTSCGRRDKNQRVPSRASKIRASRGPLPLCPLP
jgi:hypothetical protein